MSRIDKIVNKALDNVMENEVSQDMLNQWWKDDFPCDIWYDENDLASIDEDDLETIQCDWVAEYVNYFVEEVCIELGLELSLGGTLCHEEFIEDLHDMTKERVLDEIQNITEKVCNREKTGGENMAKYVLPNNNQQSNLLKDRLRENRERNNDNIPVVDVEEEKKKNTSDLLHTKNRQNTLLKQQVDECKGNHEENSYDKDKETEQIREILSDIDKDDDLDR